MKMEIANLNQANIQIDFKSIHRLDFDIERYIETLEVPPVQLATTINWMAGQLQRSKQEKLRVLIIGGGAGRLEIPFIESLINQHFNLEVIFLDYSPISNETLIQGLNDRKLFEKARIDVITEDFEDWLPTSAEKWDIIVAFFVINFFSDWLAGLRKIFSLLTPGGLFFISEDAGDIRFLDNTLYPIDKALQNSLHYSKVNDRVLFYRFWQRYYELREQKGYIWRPLISPSNMGMFVNIFKILHKLDLGSFTDPFDCEWDSHGLTWNEWLDIIRERQVFNCLCIIPSELRWKLANDIENWLLEELKDDNKLDNIPTIKLGQKIFCYKVPTDMLAFQHIANYVIEAEYKAGVFHSIAYRRPYFLDLRTEYMRTDEHIRRIINTHYHLPQKGGIAFSTVSWFLVDLGDSKKGGWSQNVPILVPEQFTEESQRFKYCLSYAIYMCISLFRENKSLHGWSLVSDVLLHEMPEKLMIFIETRKEEYVEIEHFKDAKQVAIRITLDMDKISSIRNFAQKIIENFFSMSAQEFLSSELFEFPKLPLLPLEDVLKLRDRLWNQHKQKIDALFKIISQYGNQLESQFKQALQNAGLQQGIAWKNTNIDIIAKSFSMIYANTIIGAGTKHEWTNACFIPARSIEQIQQRAQGKWEVGLVGFICYYSPKDLTNASNNWKLMQDLLCINVNLYGLEDTIHQYANLIRGKSKKSAIAAIMARNMSHNIGSHVLASTELLKGVHRNEIQKLHNFLQQRMDFIAQVVTYTPSWGEPIFFFNDLLQGFLDQYLLLGHLIKDQGYSDIKVVVHINGKEWIFKRDERQRCENENCGQPIQEGSGEKICQCENKKTTKMGRWLLQSNSNSLNDFLVAIPGGAIGAHAFYDIIENNMRNSAKYGKKTDAKGRLCDEFELHIRVEEDDERYRITLWDNLSRRDEGEHSGKPACSCCVCKVQRSLQEELISPITGEVVAQSRGVHEMKECARILVYPYEEWGFQRGGKSYALGADGIMHEGREYLSLQFYIQKPRLVGIVSAVTINDSKAKRSGVFHYEDLHELTNHAHQFDLILMPENAEEQQKTLDFIASHHHLLPYRLLLVANNRIEYEDFKIPKRRVHWCTPNEIIWPQDGSAQGWLNFIIRIYELWLQKYKLTTQSSQRTGFFVRCNWSG